MQKGCEATVPMQINELMRRKVYSCIRLLLEKNRLKRVNNKEVVLIAQYIKPRVSKIGYALRNKKFKVILMVPRGAEEQLNSTNKKYYDKLLFFSNSEELMAKCLIFSPLVFHIFTEAYVPDWAAFIVKNRDKIGKIVYDQYDIYRGLVVKTFDQFAKNEKFCLENADGLCCRMMETEYLRENYKYNYKGKRILFLDYCWNTYN